MNQILNTNLNNDVQSSEKKKTTIKRSFGKNIRFFKLQFVFSILLILALLGFIFYYIFSLQNKKELTDNLLGNYGIYRLYSNISKEDSNEEVTTTSEAENNLFGIIEIPKLSIYYPVFSHLEEDLLKISPCKFYGPSPKEKGNICIAGHNYNNSMFFSKLHLLSNEDQIYLYDNSGYKYVYNVFKTYEVNEDDLSPIFDYNTSSKELTLVTCNNMNSNRLIVKSKQLEWKK